jgi:hypothetical protein
MVFFGRSFYIFVIFFVQCTYFNVYASLSDLHIPNILFIQYWNQTKPMIYSQHEIFLQNLHHWNKNENYEKEIKWYVYGLIILFGDKDHDLVQMKKSITIDDAIKLHSSDVRMIGIKLQALGENLLKLKFDDEAIYIYELCSHILSLGERDDIRSFQLSIMLKLGDLYSSLQRHNNSRSAYTEIASVLDKTNRFNSILGAQISLKRAAAICESDPLNETKTDCLMVKEYVKTTLVNPTDLVHALNISARVNFAYQNYEIAELELRECLKILSTQCHVNETNQEYLSLNLNLADIYFAQAKWFHGATTLEKYLRPYSQNLQFPQEKEHLYQLIKRALGAYSQASKEFFNARKYQESKLSRERAVKMTSDWQTWLLQFNSSDQMDRYEKNYSSPVPPNPISKNFTKIPMQNQSADPMVYKRHVLDILVFWTVVLILVSSGLYSVSGLSPLAAMSTIPTPTIHSTLQFKSP